jgi:3-hydroxyacyl-[acyl-carrier-protein] dehydratase
MHFQLVDRVLERRHDGITTLKSVTSAEEYLRDHFPGFPILPGVMMLEAMVQAARAWVDGLTGDEGFGQPTDDTLVIAEVRNVVYAAMVRPGETLRVDVSCLGRDEDGVFAFQGSGEVLDVRGAAPRQAVKARFRLRSVSLGDLRPCAAPPTAAD